MPSLASLERDWNQTEKVTSILNQVQTDLKGIPIPMVVGAVHAGVGTTLPAKYEVVPSSLHD